MNDHQNSKLRILMLFQSAPMPPPMTMSSAKRNYPFLAENLKRHDVTVLGFGLPKEQEYLRTYLGSRCSGVTLVSRRRARVVSWFLQIWYVLTGRSTFELFYDKGLQKELDALVRGNRFDLVHCGTQLFGVFDLPRHVPLVSDSHGVEYNIFLQRKESSKNPLVKLFYAMNYRASRRREIESLKKFDLVVTAIPTDRTEFERHLPAARYATIENGVDESFFEKIDVAEEPHSMVFMGMMKWYPNHHGILWFLEKVFPLVRESVPTAKVYVVGPQPAAEVRRFQSANVEVTGFVDDVRPVIAKGQVFIIPLLLGIGIRTKALEVMAMRRPMVSTTIGCEGLGLDHERSVLFADDPATFAAAVLRLFQDSALRTRLADEAFEIVQRRFRWQMKGEQLNDLYASVTEKHRVAAQR